MDGWMDDMLHGGFASCMIFSLFYEYILMGYKHMVLHVSLVLISI